MKLMNRSINKEMNTWMDGGTDGRMDGRQLQDLKWSIPGSGVLSTTWLSSCDELNHTME